MLLLNSGQVKGKQFIVFAQVQFLSLTLGQLLHPFPDGFMAILRCNEAVIDA